MQLNSLNTSKKRIKPEPIGRGGKRGKTSGRGHKGQKSRAGHKIRPEMRDIIKKIPKLRGHGKNRSRTVRTNLVAVTAVNLSELEMAYSVGEKVSPATLVSKGLVRRVGGRVPFVKILGTGSITKALVVDRCQVSNTAREAIVKVGGTVNGE